MIRAQVSRMLGCGGERAKHTNYMEKTHLHPTPAENTDLTLRKQVNTPLWNTNWHPPLGRALCAQCGDITAFHLSRHATLLPRGQEAGTALQKEYLVKHSLCSRHYLLLHITDQPFPPGTPRHCPTLHHGSPQMSLREEKEFQTAGWLNSPKTWV